MNDPRRDQLLKDREDLAGILDPLPDRVRVRGLDKGADGHEKKVHQESRL